MSRLRAFAIAGLAVVAIFAAAAMLRPRENGDEPERQFLPPGGPVIVLQSSDSAAWVRLERASGASFRPGMLDELIARPVGIVPAGAVLSSADHQVLHRWVAEGGRLVTAHPDVLAGLGFKRQRAVSLQGAPMDIEPGRATWQAAVEVAGLAKGKLLESFAPVVTENGTVLVAEARRGRGSVLALAVDPLAEGRAGHELLPGLGRMVAAWTRAPAGPRREAAEVYIDPGSLPAALKKDAAATAAQLVGVRAAHVAAWHFGFRDPANDYDYAGLIAALHARGIAAYAWLEPPQVNLLMWEDHPECREKTATGRDAQVDWRVLIALEDEKCFQLAWEQWRKVLGNFDWDGVNVAELYFEPDIRQENFTPFHPSAIARFGGDPFAVVGAFWAFRTGLVAELNSRMLAGIRALPNGRDLDLQLTVIDDTLDPSHAKAVGSDVAQLAVVARDHGASLQLEDPFTAWAASPLRYEKVSARLPALLPTGQAFLDINVVPREAGVPTISMTAAEFDLAVMSASAVSGRLAMFSLGTIGPEDLSNLASAMAGGAETLDSGVRSTFAVRVLAPGGPGFGRLTVDGVPWPVAAGSAIIPGGEHRLEWSEGVPAGPALLALNGEIGSAVSSAGSLAMSYFSRARAYAVLDRAPLGIEIDGRPAELRVVAHPGGGHTVQLPAGTHAVTMTFGE